MSAQASPDEELVERYLPKTFRLLGEGVGTIYSEFIDSTEAGDRLFREEDEAIEELAGLIRKWLTP